MNPIFVDSDILIEVSRSRNDIVVERWTELASSESTLLCSPVSVAELWQGVFDRARPALEALLSAMLCVPIDQETGRKAGEYLRSYRKSHGLMLGDALIAAAASIHGATLWTRNRKHYPMKDIVLY